MGRRRRSLLGRRPSAPILAPGGPATRPDAPDTPDADEVPASDEVSASDDAPASDEDPARAPDVDDAPAPDEDPAPAADESPDPAPPAIDEAEPPSLPDDPSEAAEARPVRITQEIPIPDEVVTPVEELAREVAALGDGLPGDAEEYTSGRRREVAAPTYEAGEAPFVPEGDTLPDPGDEPTQPRWDDDESEEGDPTLSPRAEARERIAALPAAPIRHARWPSRAESRSDVPVYASRRAMLLGWRRRRQRSRLQVAGLTADEAQILGALGALSLTMLFVGGMGFMVLSIALGERLWDVLP